MNLKNGLDLDEKLDKMLVSGFPLTADQKTAMRMLAEWLEKHRGNRASFVKTNWATGVVKPPVFRLFGLAGCGKTTCSVAVKLLGLRPLYVSFTNRAVSVLASKGCIPAKTVHSILYDVYDEGDDQSPQMIAAQQAYLAAVEQGLPPSERPALPPARNKVGWERRDYDQLQEAVAGYDCIVVDEASMVGRRMGEDLEYIGLPIIGVGDPGQLPPVGDLPYFDPVRPDYLLTKVLRTDGDILDIAAYVRRGGSFTGFRPGTDYEVRRKADPSWFDSDQVLCGIHEKRRELNKHVRRLRGYEGFLPNQGEKLCAVANNKELGVTNGSLWTVVDSWTEGDYAVMDLLEYAPRKKKEDLELLPAVPVHMTCFVQDIKNREEIPLQVRSDSALMTWGYAITVHKAQGSEWNSVLLFDDGHIFREDVRKWRYTGATRAAKKLYIVSRH